MECRYRVLYNLLPIANRLLISELPKRYFTIAFKILNPLIFLLIQFELQLEVQVAFLVHVFLELLFDAFVFCLCILVQVVELVIVCFLLHAVTQVLLGDALRAVTVAAFWAFEELVRTFH